MDYDQLILIALNPYGMPAWLERDTSEEELQGYQCDDWDYMTGYTGSVM